MPPKPKPPKKPQEQAINRDRPCLQSQIHAVDDYFFWAEATKLLILPDLLDFNIPWSPQNIADK